MDVGMNLGCGEAVGEATADKEIVDTPPDVSCTGCRTETPPAVSSAAVGIQGYGKGRGWNSGNNAGRGRGGYGFCGGNACIYN